MIDLLLHNGRILTMDTARPRATALAIAHGRLLAVGGEELLGLKPQAKRVEDLRGACVVPGMVDAHIHWSWEARTRKAIRVEYLTTKRKVLAVIAEAARKAEPGTWLTGRGWAQGDWTDTPNQFPTAADLDAIAPNNPVFLSARSGHAGWANSLAMKLAGVTPSTPDPPQGTLQRDKSGNPTGIFFEDAIDLVRDVIPKASIEKIADLMEEAQPVAWSKGLTGMHDYDGTDCFAALQLQRERGTLGLRMVKNVNDPDIGAAWDLRARSHLGDAWLRLGGLKMFSDGAIGSVTALMIEPYEGDPSNYGLRVMPRDRMEEFALEGTRRGWHSTIHAIGDLAVREVLDIIEKCRAEEQRLGIARANRRHRIEHVQLLHPDDEHRLGKLGIVASMQPIHATADIDMADRYWGKRAAHGYNPRVQLDCGAVVAFGSDAPVEPMDPLLGIHAAVTRRRVDGYPGPEGWYPNARVTVEEALRAYTVGPAWAAGLEHELGQLAPGFLADLVVLDQDPTAIDPHTIPAIAVLGTMIDGVWRHRVEG